MECIKVVGVVGETVESISFNQRHATGHKQHSQFAPADRCAGELPKSFLRASYTGCADTNGTSSVQATSNLPVLRVPINSPINQKPAGQQISSKVLKDWYWILSENVLFNVRHQLVLPESFLFIWSLSTNPYPVGFAGHEPGERTEQESIAG